MLPPVLEIYVLWHPDDPEGAGIAEILLEHFRGTAFSGLIGGAVEVYVRSESGTGEPNEAPRPLPCVQPMPYGVLEPSLTAVVVVAGAELASDVEIRGTWHDYLKVLVDARTANPETVGIFAVRTANHVFEGTRLGALLGDILGIAGSEFGTDEFAATLCRDLAQGVAQMGELVHARITVFVSHTKRLSPMEQPGISSLVQLVRDVISETRLDEFFDAHDLQANQDWVPALDAAASTGALLAVRTDLYSSRPWCQREVLTAKRNGMPVVILDALTDGEERGSFVMDHVPRTPGRQVDNEWRRTDVVRALGQLVDECLKRVLWRRQRELAELTTLPLHVTWWAAHAPEPTTFLAWLVSTDGRSAAGDKPIVVLHPDPPLGPDEQAVLSQLAEVANLRDGIEFLTPRGLAARGG